MHWCCGPIEAVGPEVVSVETKDTDTIPTNSPKEDPAKTGDDASERGASVHSIGNRNEIDEEEDLISGKCVGWIIVLCVLNNQSYRSYPFFKT
jgi:hypothetical protein